MTQRSGFDLVPTTARVISVGLYALVVSALLLRGKGPLPEFLLMSVALLIPATFIMLSGFVYGDAKQRSMRAGWWTALALLAPSGIGFIIYFLLRKPMTKFCCGCGRTVELDASFCSGCGVAQVRR